jgi:hypothetical protein
VAGIGHCPRGQRHVAQVEMLHTLLARSATGHVSLQVVRRRSVDAAGQEPHQFSVARACIDQMSAPSATSYQLAGSPKCDPARFSSRGCGHGNSAYDGLPAIASAAVRRCRSRTDGEAAAREIVMAIWSRMNAERITLHAPGRPGDGDSTHRSMKQMSATRRFRADCPRSQE